MILHLVTRPRSASMRGFLVPKEVAELRIPIVRTARNVHTKYGAFLLVLARAYRMNIGADRSAIESDFGPDPHLGGRSDMASQACNTTTVATVFGWQNDGVWTLHLERRGAFVSSASSTNSNT